MVTTTSETAREVPPVFTVAFSFAGEQRALVREIALAVERILGRSTVFFDEWYVHYIAGVDADALLKQIYRDRATLVVECLSAEQQDKPWTRLEAEAIKERLARDQMGAHGNARWSVLTLEVAAGGITERSRTIAPPAYRLPVAETARLIVDRLLLAPAVPSAASEAAARSAASPAPASADLQILHVTDFDASQTLIRNAMALYESRLPNDEQYDHETMVDLVRRHLSDEFAPDWTAHLLVALFRGQTVGMLLCYEHLKRNLAFISYLVAYNPRIPGTHPPDISEEVATRLMAVRTERGLPPASYLFEVDDPALADNAKERRHRASRLKIFGELAPFRALHLRALDIPYLQPNLTGPVQGGERPLLLCYAAPRLGSTLSRADAVDLLRWTYTELYGDDIYTDPAERAAWAHYTRDLLARVSSGLPDPVRLLKHDEAGDPTGRSEDRPLP